MKRIAAIAALLVGTGCSPIVIDFPEQRGRDGLSCGTGYYPDADGDGYGEAGSEPTLACAPLPGTSTVANDCDDQDPDIQPGAAERCDGRDNDCDGQIDEGAAQPATWYADRDSDGYGDPEDSTRACEAPEGFVADALDCDDADAGVHPGAVERCDGADQDCDGSVDEACATCDLAVPEGFTSVLDAVAAAPEGATICVGPGTWSGPLDLGSRSLTLLGTHGSSATTLDAGGDDSVVRTGGGRVTISGFTLSGGLAWQGGGVDVRGGQATLSDLRIVACEATEGGGLHLDAALTTLADVRIEDCEADSGGGIAVQDGEAHLTRVWIGHTLARDGYGGGIAAERAVLELEGVTVEGAEARGGGGLSLTSCQTTARGVILLGNLATDDGGGGLLQAEGVLSAEELRLEGDRAAGGSGGGARLKGGRFTGARVRFVDDSADAGDGGGLFIESGQVELSWVAFETDQAWGNGGALAATGDADLILTQVVAVGSSARGGGVLQLCDHVTARLDHVLIASNRATAGPGGAFAVADDATLVVGSAILSDNQASRGAALSLRDTAQVRVTDASLHANRGGVSVQADVTPGARLVMAGITVSGSAPWAALSASSALSYDIDQVNLYDAGPRPVGGLSSHGRLGSLQYLDPVFADTTSTSPLFWDLHLGRGSGLLDAGDPALSDPDGSRSDIGAWGTFEAGTWDLDGDGAPSWWQPGAYDGASYPAQGWDCDDLDPTVFPGSGC
ncbi:MAG: putative metal-binding motif-containing protein [Pseudomonadota bacterium]